MPVGYMCVSTDGDHQVLDLQRDALLAAGIDGWHLFEDRVSGSRETRGGSSKALAFLQAGDCLVVWKLDWLGRSLPHLLATVNELKARGMGFMSLAESMDTTTPQGEFLFHIFGALAQFEHVLTIERVQAGLEAARRRGRRGGRPVVIDPEKLAAVTAALNNGSIKAAVCRAFGLKRSTLLDTLGCVDKRLQLCPSSKHLAQSWRRGNGERASSGVFDVSAFGPDLGLRIMEGLGLVAVT